MINEEKAREIELNVYAFREKPKGEFQAPAYRAALEMAKWKDKQFKEYLQNKIDKLCEFGCKTNSSEITKSCADKMVVLGEIINELFKEEQK